MGCINSKQSSITYKGRSLGIVALTVVQLFIGVVHVFFGVLLFAVENLTFIQGALAYNSYTVIFGVLVTVFAVSIWQGKKAGWIGTVAVSLFVIAADALAVLDLPRIPGIPKSAAVTEIAYSLLVIFYLSVGHVRRKFFAS